MKKLKLFKPYVSWRARWYALKVLMGTQLAEGPMVRQFEREFAEKFHKENVCMLNSGTSALELAYELAGIGPGDEVITPVLTCTATNLPLVRRGATLVFADVDPKTLNVSVEDVARKITDRTKAIVFVHFGGSNRGLGQLLVLARERGIRVIEDAAQAIGAGSSRWGRADYTAVSLQAIKSLTAGDGGVLICRDPGDHAKAKKLRWFGYDREEKQKLGDTDLELAGYKYHMNDISAAIGLGNLRSLDWALMRRSRARKAYQIEAFKRGVYMRLTPWLAILVHPKALAIADFLKSEGIECGQHHYRNDKYSVFDSDHSRGGGVVGALPYMDLVEDRYLLLPFHHDITPEDVRYVMDRVAYAIRMLDFSEAAEHAKRSEDTTA